MILVWNLVLTTIFACVGQVLHSGYTKSPFEHRSSVVRFGQTMWIANSAGMVDGGVVFGECSSDVQNKSFACGHLVSPPQVVIRVHIRFLFLVPRQQGDKNIRSQRSHVMFGRQLVWCARQTSLAPNAQGRLRLCLDVEQGSSHMKASAVLFGPVEWHSPAEGHSRQPETSLCMRLTSVITSTYSQLGNISECMLISSCGLCRKAGDRTLLLGGCWGC